MKSTVKERLKLFLKSEGISQKQFESLIGAGNGYVNNISKSIGTEKAQRISQMFPHLSLGWLLTGEGQMLLQSDGIHIGRNNMSGGQIGGTSYNTYNPETPRTDECIENGYKTTAGIQETVAELISMIRSKDEDIRKLIGMLQEKDTFIKTLIEKADK